MGAEKDGPSDRELGSENAELIRRIHDQIAPWRGRSGPLFSEAPAALVALGGLQKDGRISREARERPFYLSIERIERWWRPRFIEMDTFAEYLRAAANLGAPPEAIEPRAIAALRAALLAALALLDAAEEQPEPERSLKWERAAAMAECSGRALRPAPLIAIAGAAGGGPYPRRIPKP